MKLLFLSTCGKTNEPEDAAYLDLFLASFARHVLPAYPESKMLLYSTFAAPEGQPSLIQTRADAFGLAGIVEVRHLRDMELPPASEKFLYGQSWYANIGLNMNMLFDYAKKRDFYGADWIFHTDTDMEFLPNFAEFLNPIHQMTTLVPELVITVAGDAYPYNIYYKNKEYIFQDAKRVYLYDEEQIKSMHSYSYQRKQIRLNPHRRHPREQEHRLIFNIQQQKVRNDFVGLSRAAATRTNFNWVATGYHEHFSANHEEATDVEKELAALWEEHEANSSLRVNMNLSEDKGASVQYALQSNELYIARIQLRGYTDMAKHFSSGYVDFFIYQGENFRQYSHRRLREEYGEWSSIWAQDYP